MKITKYEHACWDVIVSNTRIIIDPGEFSASLTDLANIAAVVVTHIHGDHLDHNLLARIVEQNPNIQIFGPQQVADELKQPVAVPELGKTYGIGSMTLEFFGKDHHLYEDTDNIAVSINQTFFVPGDSYIKPSKPVKIAAVPVSAPWFRIDEGIANINEVQAHTVIPTHDALLSDIGKAIHYRILGEAAKNAGKAWKVLEPGETIDG